ncbi:IQ domain-containing protein C [Motacilla alba alba]|uniref:IQ domain-containing protein C n=1 Tax=Motacilla alba alba TaxID=1094192 RepID=UPI0018D52C15|nr:IQ domain-containing protein C [Motacilla alba alba]
MTSAGGAGAMAAAPGPRAGAEAEQRRRLLRSVTRLQVRDPPGGTRGHLREGTPGRAPRARGCCSRRCRPCWAAFGAGAGARLGSSGAPGPCQACARGFLLRRRLRGVREEFEAAVLEIEGDLRQLRWSGRVLLRPRFGPELREPRESGTGSGNIPGSGARAQPSPGNPLDPGEAAENKTIPRKTREKPNPRGAERAGSCGTIPPSAPRPRGTTPDPKNPKKNPDLGPGAAESPEEEEEEELGASPGIPEELAALPRAELESLRKDLLLELLWVQQAVASRKHFLQLKQTLGVPAPPGSIAPFLPRCAEALELQQP